MVSLLQHPRDAQVPGPLICRELTYRLLVERLAREARMWRSALHRHFTAVTTMSPVQYQKLLRLHEARRLMLGEALEAAEASFKVGYESASQFSREYRRLFGAPPRRDIESLRTTQRRVS